MVLEKEGTVEGGGFFSERREKDCWHSGRRAARAEETSGVIVGGRPEKSRVGKGIAHDVS